MTTAVRTGPRRRRPLRDRLPGWPSAATTPLLPADYLDLFDPLRSRRRPARPHRRRPPRDPRRRHHRDPPGRDWAGHVPGQYVRIGVDVDGVRQWRAYSLTHGPRADGRISITVKAVPDGKVSNHLVHHARPGTLVHLEQATGEFVLPDRAARKLLFVTAGSGITPVIGMLRNLFPVADAGVVRLAQPDYDIVVVHVAPSEPDSIFLRQPARARRRRADPAGRAAQRRARPPRRRRPGRAGARPGRAAPRSPAARPACSTRSQEHHDDARPAAAHRAVPRRDASSPARAAPSRSPGPARRSRPTARPRSSTPPRTPAC